MRILEMMQEAPKFPTAEEQLEILKEARRLVAAGWCQGPYAQDAEGKTTDVLSPNACKFCSWGSILRAYDLIKGFDVPVRLLNSPAAPCVEAVERHISEKCLVEWNERSRRTQEEVVEAFDQAIAAQECAA